jgi:hypothetical protein
MLWTTAHSKTAAAGLVSLAATALLFRPSSFMAGVLMVLLVWIAVAVTDKIRTDAAPRRRGRVGSRSG